MPATLSSRLTIWYISAFSIFLIAAFGIMYLSINQILDSRIDEDLIEDIDEFRVLLNEEGLDRVKLEIDREVQFGSLNSIFLRLLNSDGIQLFSSDTSLFLQDPATDTSFDQVSVAEGVVLKTVARGIMDEDEDVQDESFREVVGMLGDGYLLHIGESLEEKQEMMEAMLYSFVLILFAVLPVAGLIGWMMARNAVKGIQEVSHIAEKIHRGQLQKRVLIKAKDREIVHLSSTFNAMLDRIRDLITEMREMTDNIAHDLKSPLARIRIISEQVLSKSRTAQENQLAATQTIEECDRLLKMINDSLDVAEAEVGIVGNGKVDFDFSDLVRDAYELFEPVAEQKGITLTCNIKTGCRFLGNEQVFQRSISNLMDNAIRYTDEGGQVNIALDYNDTAISVIVSDSGIGISEEDQTRIFSRFYRCDRSRSQDGCGLGLNYSRAVARAHGGDTVLTSKLTQGSIFTFSLPVNLPA